MNGILLRMIDISGYLSNNAAVSDWPASPFIMLSPSMTKYVTFSQCLLLSNTGYLLNQTNMFIIDLN